LSTIFAIYIYKNALFLRFSYLRKFSPNSAPIFAINFFHYFFEKTIDIYFEICYYLSIQVNQIYKEDFSAIRFATPNCSESQLVENN